MYFSVSSIQQVRNWKMKQYLQDVHTLVVYTKIFKRKGLQSKVMLVLKDQSKYLHSIITISVYDNKTFCISNVTMGIEISHRIPVDLSGSQWVVNRPFSIFFSCRNAHQPSDINRIVQTGIKNRKTDEQATARIDIEHAYYESTAAVSTFSGNCRHVNSPEPVTSKEPPTASELYV